LQLYDLKLGSMSQTTAGLIHGVIDLASGDVNGDGLEDLVAASATNIQVLLGTVAQ